MEEGMRGQLLGMAREAGASLQESVSIVSLGWDRETAETGAMLGDKRALDDVVTTFEFRKGEEEALNPLQWAALVAYVTPESPSDEELYRLSKALYLYSVIDREIGGFPQRHAALRFFRQKLPEMVGRSGYQPLERGIEGLLDCSVLAEEVAKIVENLQASPAAEAVRRFYNLKGEAAYLQTADEGLNRRAAEVVWRTLPRLIKVRGYVPLEKLVEGVVPQTVRGTKREYIAKYLMGSEELVGASEAFPNTMAGDLLYVSPAMREGANATATRIMAERFPSKETKALLKVMRQRYVRQLVGEREKRDSQKAGEAFARLIELGYDENIAGVLLASAQLGEVLTQLPRKKEEKHKISSAVKQVVGNYTSYLHSAFAETVRQIAYEDACKLREFADYAEAPWGRGDDVEEIRKSANRLEGSIPAPRGMIAGVLARGADETILRDSYKAVRTSS